VAKLDERVMAIAQEIESYLAEYPNAADTAVGVHNWWRPSSSIRGSPAEVQQALDHLVERGSVVRTVRGDGTVTYGRAAVKH
jgi:hypothetical protein